MRIPNPIATTTTEAYLAYKAGVLAQADLKEKLYHPYIHIDGWLAYWTGLADTYPTDKNGDPECLTDEEAYIAYLAGVTSEYPEALKDPADPRMAGYLKYLISARFGRPNYPVTREELYLSMMKPPVVPSGDPSSSIDLEGTAEYPFISMEVYGDTYQKTYSGKNLLECASGTSENGITTSVTNDESLSLNISGTPTAPWGALTSNFYNPSLSAGTYTLCIDKALPFNITFRARVSATGEWTAWVIPAGSKSATATLGGPQYFSYIYVGGVETGKPLRQTVKIQLVAGSTPDYNFEPYTCGIPSPSPDCPQDIQTATGRQVVVVTGGNGESAEYEINLGKNLFDKDNADVFNGFVNGNNGVLTAATNLQRSVIIPIEPNTTYTVQGLKRSANSGVFASYPQAGSQSTGVYVIPPSTGTLTFTSGSNGHYFVTMYSAEGDGLTYDTIQLEKGSTATSYAPYFEPIELCKIGDYQDYIYRDEDENWYLHKEVEHLPLAITNMNNYEDAPGWSSVENIREYIGTGINGPMVSATDYCSNITSSATIGGIRMNTNGSNAVIYLSPAVWGSSFTQTYWKTNYPNLTLELYYGIAVAASQTDTQITNSALIAQLDALVEGGSYEGGTHIRVSATDPNLPALLKVEAAKY